VPLSSIFTRNFKSNIRRHLKWGTGQKGNTELRNEHSLSKKKTYK
jgi:hypothetical protein